MVILTIIIVMIVIDTADTLVVILDLLRPEDAADFSE